MPQERENPFPFPTAKEAEEAPGDRETKAARFVVVRHIPGIPRRAYILGESDHAPILKGVKDLTTICWALLDWIQDASDINGLDFPPAAEELRTLLTDHGCPEELEKATL